jgi:hypothetical protein
MSVVVGILAEGCARVLVGTASGGIGAFRHHCRMAKRRRRALWRNGTSYPLGGEAPSRPATVTDFAIVLVQNRMLGTIMEWWSHARGLLTPFVHFDHLEDPVREYLDASGEPRRLRD